MKYQYQFISLPPEILVRILSNLTIESLETVVVAFPQLASYKEDLLLLHEIHINEAKRLERRLSRRPLRRELVARNYLPTSSAPYVQGPMAVLSNQINTDILKARNRRILSNNIGSRSSPYDLRNKILIPRLSFSITATILSKVSDLEVQFRSISFNKIFQNVVKEKAVKQGSLVSSKIASASKSVEMGLIRGIVERKLSNRIGFPLLDAKKLIRSEHYSAQVLCPGVRSIIRSYERISLL